MLEPYHWSLLLDWSEGGYDSSGYWYRGGLRLLSPSIGGGGGGRSWGLRAAYGVEVAYGLGLWPFSHGVGGRRSRGLGAACSGTAVAA
jgi:hypothetical protein